MREELSPGRPREFDETQMLRKIMKLFWRGGYEGVSLADIMTETGLKKGSLYAAYGDKRAMYLKALGQYEADIVANAAKFLTDQNLPPLERLEAFLSAPLAALDQGDRSGCFLCNASADQADLDLATKTQVAKGFDQLTQGLVNALSDLYPNPTRDDARTKARTLLTIYIGLRIMVRSGAESRTLDPIVKTALKLSAV